MGQQRHKHQQRQGGIGQKRPQIASMWRHWLIWMIHELPNDVNCENRRSSSDLSGLSHPCFALRNTRILMHAPIQTEQVLRLPTHHHQPAVG
jgi:hypothetical protein